jgi:hypothetical protein
MDLNDIKKYPHVLKAMCTGNHEKVIATPLLFRKSGSHLPS